jgi:hypothetical protein
MCIKVVVVVVVVVVMVIIIIAAAAALVLTQRKTCLKAFLGSLFRQPISFVSYFKVEF